MRLLFIIIHHSTTSSPFFSLSLHLLLYTFSRPLFTFSFVSATVVFLLSGGLLDLIHHGLLFRSGGCFPSALLILCSPFLRVHTPPTFDHFPSSFSRRFRSHTIPIMKGAVAVAVASVALASAAASPAKIEARASSSASATSSGSLPTVTVKGNGESCHSPCFDCSSDH